MVNYCICVLVLSFDSSNNFFYNLSLYPTGKHVVFGKVLEGYDVVQKIEKVGSQSGKPSKTVRIAESGEVPLN